MDELDEIAQLEAASQDLMTEPAPPSRNRGATDADKAAAGKATTSRSKPLAGSKSLAEQGRSVNGDSPQVESLLVEIRDRLDRLLLANAPSQENPQPNVVTEDEHREDPAADDPDDLRKAFPHEEGEGAEKLSAEKEAEKELSPSPQSAGCKPVLNVTLPEKDMAQLVGIVEDRVTRHALTHHSSIIVLLGWAMALLAAALGMGYGFIVASGRYPFWDRAEHDNYLHMVTGAFLGAPVGVVLLPIAGALLWEASREATGEKNRIAVKLVSVCLFFAGIVLPLISLL